MANASVPPALGPPRPPDVTKQAGTERLGGLWSGAEQEIENASAVVCVGYRFPPTDSLARRKIINAIEANFAASVLCLHTVLGPSVGDAFHPKARVDATACCAVARPAPRGATVTSAPSHCAVR